MLTWDTTFNSKTEFFWGLILTLMYYFLTIVFIMSAHQGIMINEFNFCEKARNEPAVNKDGNYEVDPNQDQEISVTAKVWWKYFVLWLVSWTPKSFQRRF